MICTSAQAAKLLKRLQEELALQQALENASRSFAVSVGENAEELRPEYSFAETQEKLAAIEEKIRRVKHAINVFNISTVLPETDMTIDEALVYMPQLNLRKNKLSGMAATLPRVRQSGMNSNIITYTLTNYDAAQAKKAYEQAAEELAGIQTALDLVNTTKTMEIDIEM